MENAFFIAMAQSFLEIRWQMIMFFADIIILGTLSEFIKATLFPKKDETTKASGKFNECPRWLGLIFGILVTLIHIVCSFLAYSAFGTEGWYIPGGYIFAWAWAILFFFLQFKALRIVKWFRDKLFPGLKDPNYVKTQKNKEKKKSYSKEELEKILANLTSEESTT